MSSPGQIAYDQYRFIAEVDWLDIGITTNRVTNAPTVRRHLPGASYVSALGAGNAGEATQFVARIQQPDSWAYIADSLATLSASIPLAESPAVTSIEVCLDAYSKRHSKDDLVAVAAHFYAALQNSASDNHRFTGIPGKQLTEGVRNRGHLKSRLASDRVIFIGDRDADHAQRIYVKTKDDGGLALATRLHRARVENRFTGHQLPPLTWAQWQGYDFSRLSHWFKFREIGDSHSREAHCALNWAPQFGQMRGTGRRKFPHVTRADVRLNRKAYDALRRLAEKMQKLRTGTTRNPLKCLISATEV